MTPYELKNLIDDLRLDTPGCPFPLHIRKIVDATREFCRRSLVWREDLATIIPLEGTTSYALTPPDGTEIIDLDTVKQFNGVGHNTLDPWNEEPDGTVLGSIASHYWRPTRDSIGIWPVPNSNIDATHVITPKVALMPTQAGPAGSGPSVDQEFFETWRHGLMYGSLFMLLAIPGKEWSNPQMSSYYESEFSSIIADAVAVRLKGGTRKALQATWPSL